MKKLLFFLLFIGFTFSLSAVDTPIQTIRQTGAVNTEYTTTGIVTAKLSNGFWIQDTASSGSDFSGIFIYHRVDIPDVGQMVSLTGKYKLYHGLAELTNITGMNVIQTADPIPNPISVETFTSEKESMIISLLHSPFTVTVLPDSNDIMTVVDSMGTEFKVRNRLYNYPDPVIGTVYSNITGILDNYDSFRVLPRDASDIVILEDACTNTICGDFEHCEVVDGAATCVCNTGYHKEELRCLSDTKLVNCTDNAPTNGTSIDAQVTITWDSNTNSWPTAEDCEWTCDAGYYPVGDSCEAISCTPGEKRCDGNTVEKCSDDGTSWQRDGDCELLEVCQEGSCVAINCVDDQVSGVVDSGCNDLTPVCDVSGLAPVCVVCTVNEDCLSNQICDITTNLCEDAPDPCANIDCSGHGQCVVDNNEVTCNCEAGYHPVGTTCIENNFAVGDVIITEFMANPEVTGDNDAEWIEIYNTTANPIDLTDLIIVRSKGASVNNHEAIFVGNKIINSHDYMLIARTTDLSKLENVDATSDFALGNKGAKLELKLYDIILDEVVYVKENVGKGKSWQLDPAYLNSVANDNSEVWCLGTTVISNVNSDLGTPRLANISCGNEDPCTNVDCSGHGTCDGTSGIAICTCEDGYHAEATSCVEDPTCANVTCSGHGSCQINDYVVVCNCEDGYHAVGLECIQDVNSCDNITCSNHGHCDLVNNVATCICDADFHAVDLECISDDPCTDVDCSGHGTCETIDNITTCNCDAGFIASGLTCIEDTFAEGDVIITEIMANPHVKAITGVGTSDSKAEWMEIYNTTNHTIDLAGLKVLKANNVYDVDFVNNTNLESHAYMLIARTIDLSKLDNVKATSSFEFVNSPSGISIKLRNTILDAITYEEPAKGKSWQLDPQSFDSVNNDNTSNWCFATLVIPNPENRDYGTPGFENSSCIDLCAGNSCEEWETCDSSDGSCKLANDRCIANTDCTILATPVCDMDTHKCVAETQNCDPACKDWESCNSGACEVNNGRCNEDSDCTDTKTCDTNNNCVDPNNPCEGITCGDNGTCKIVNTLATCECSVGYKADGLTCIEDTTDLCANVTCDTWLECNASNGSCELKSGMCGEAADCTNNQTCDANHNCVDQESPCKGITCSGHGTCVDSEMASCNCDDGYHAVNLTCVENTDNEQYKGSSLLGCSYNQSSNSPFAIFILLGLAIFILRRKEEK